MDKKDRGVCDVCCLNDTVFGYVNEEHPELHMMMLCGKCGEEFEDNFWTCTEWTKNEPRI
tara:strand:+ start:371 stop:550 length:180 start_codon:yes stop_codon:yes gene_type:complete